MSNQKPQCDVASVTEAFSSNRNDLEHQLLVKYADIADRIYWGFNFRNTSVTILVCYTDFNNDFFFF